MNPRSKTNASRNEKAFRSFSYTLVFLMMVCAIITVGNLIHTLVPHWHSGIIAGILLFIVVDRLYTYRHLKSLTPLSSEWAIAFGAQWMLIALLIRFLLSYANGMNAFRTDLSLLARGYIAELFTAEFVFSFVFALLVWFLAGRFLYVLDEIGLEPALALQEGIQIEVVPAHQRLVTLAFSVGIGLVILTALARVDFRAIVSNVEGLPHLRFNRLSGGEAGTLLYFVLGLALLSLSRLMSLQTHWNRLRIPVSSKNLYRQWAIYSIFFLFILGMIVSLLPAGDSLGLFSVLRTVLGFLMGVLFFIGQVLLFLISLLFSLPMLLFLRGDPSTDAPAPPPLPVLPPVEPAPPTPDNAAWALVRSILLWGLSAVIIVFSLIQFVRQHGGLRAALRRSRITNWLILAWQWLYRGMEKTGRTLSRAISEGWQSLVSRLEEKRILPRPSLIRLRSLDPRRQIYFFYLAMIRRGAEQGVAREPSQTPSEYAVMLEKALPSAIEDIDSITKAFVQARYSRQEVDARKANIVRETWGRIRRALRSKARNEQTIKR